MIFMKHGGRVSRGKRKKPRMDRIQTMGATEGLKCASFECPSGCLSPPPPGVKGIHLRHLMNQIVALTQTPLRGDKRSEPMSKLQLFPEFTEHYPKLARERHPAGAQISSSLFSTQPNKRVQLKSIF